MVYFQKTNKLSQTPNNLHELSLFFQINSKWQSILLFVSLSLIKGCWRIIPFSITIKLLNIVRKKYATSFFTNENTKTREHWEWSPELRDKFSFYVVRSYVNYNF